MGKEQLLASLRLPVMQAPMFLVSGPEMVIAAIRAGILGCLPAANARTSEILGNWLQQIGTSARIGNECRPWAVNIVVHRTYARGDDDLAKIIAERVPVVVTALGSPADIVDRVHGYGGIVVADVNSVHYARKAAAAGVDGLLLVCSGAGGHTGRLSPFAFVEEVRGFFDGLLIVGGAIGTGRAIAAALALGADIANVGTRFIATDESIAATDYKRMVVEADSNDIVLSDRVTGVEANWLRQSLEAASIAPDAAGAAAIDFSRSADEVKGWRDIWSAGQGVGMTRRISPLADVVDELEQELLACSHLLRRPPWPRAGTLKDPA